MRTTSQIRIDSPPLVEVFDSAFVGELCLRLAPQAGADGGDVSLFIANDADTQRRMVDGLRAAADRIEREVGAESKMTR